MSFLLWSTSHRSLPVKLWVQVKREKIIVATCICLTCSCNLFGPLGPLVTEESSPELDEGDIWRMSGVFRTELLRGSFPRVYLPEGWGILLPSPSPPSYPLLLLSLPPPSASVIESRSLPQLPFGRAEVSRCTAPLPLSVPVLGATSQWNCSALVCSFRHSSSVTLPFPA